MKVFVTGKLQRRSGTKEYFDKVLPVPYRKLTEECIKYVKAVVNTEEDFPVSINIFQILKLEE